MTVLTESKYIGDVLHWEEDERFSRNTVKLATNQLIEIGSVLSKHDQTGDYHLLDPQGKEGLSKAAAVSLVHASTGKLLMDVVVVTRHALLKTNGLAWPEGITDKQQQTATDQLNLFGLVVRS
jgi:hypothetical protein